MTAYIVADTETTGVSTDDRIVELAFVIIDEHFNELSRGYSLIDPERPIPSGASALHHITDRMVANEPTLAQYMRLNSNPLYIPGSVFVAHNAPFDYRYLKDWLYPDTKRLCSLRVARKLYPDADSHKLQALRYSLGLPEVSGDAHRADADVDMLVHLLRHMCANSGINLSGLVDLAALPIPVKTWKFGKYKGQPLAAADAGYITWMLNQDNLDADLRAALLALS